MKEDLNIETTDEYDLLVVQLTNACCLNYRKKEFAKTVMVWKKLYRQFLVNNTDRRKKDIQTQVNKMLSSAKIKRTHIQNLTKLLIQNKVICGFCVSLLKKTNRDYHEVSTIYNTVSGKTSSGKSDEILVTWQIFFPDDLFSPMINFSINKFSINKWFYRKKYSFKTVKISGFKIKTFALVQKGKERLCWFYK